jgi:hypothetical protein
MRAFSATCGPISTLVHLHLRKLASSCDAGGVGVFPASPNPKATVSLQ